MAELGIEGKRGAMAANVFLGSPADNGGIRAGDFITHVNVREVRDVNQLQMIVGDLKPGDRAVFTVIRDKQTRDIQVRIEARTDQAAANNRNQWPGVYVVPLTDQFRQQMQLSDSLKGLLAYQVVSGSPADIVGVRQGDVIKSINGAEVKDIASFYTALRERTASELWFGIQRGESELESLRFKR
jgi:S1-C subfamily serine protease